MRLVLLAPRPVARGIPDPVLEADPAGVIDPQAVAVLLVNGQAVRSGHRPGPSEGSPRSSSHMPGSGHGAATQTACLAGWLT
jgi:hypothetical protein